MSGTGNRKRGRDTDNIDNNGRRPRIQGETADFQVMNTVRGSRKEDQGVGGQGGNPRQVENKLHAAQIQLSAIRTYSFAGIQQGKLKQGLRKNFLSFQILKLLIRRIGHRLAMDSNYNFVRYGIMQGNFEAV